MPFSLREIYEADRGLVLFGGVVIEEVARVREAAAVKGAPRG